MIPKPFPINLSEEEYQKSWKEGIIGQFETFLLDRYPIGKYWARGSASAYTASALSNIEIFNQLGEVRPNDFWVNISPSGLGYKTPVLKRTLYASLKMQEELGIKLVCPAKFTPEGFTEYATKTDKSGSNQHLNNFIIRDEISALVGEQRTFMNNIFEYLSELWDGYIEPYYTRKVGFEGGLQVYVTMLADASEVFLQNLTRPFFQQGLGNRVSWICEPVVEPKKTDHQFFLQRGDEDREFQEMVNDTIQILKSVNQCRYTSLTLEAEAAWMDFRDKMNASYYQKYNVGKIGDASYEVKAPLKTLKLAAIYSASRNSILYDKVPEGEEEAILLVNSGDMETAIDDTRAYIRMYYDVIKWWEQVGVERKELKQESSLSELVNFVSVAERYGWLVVPNDMMRELNLMNKNTVIDTLDLGVTKGWFNLEVFSKLGEEESNKIKKRTKGHEARVYRLTELGSRRGETKEIIS